MKLIVISPSETKEDEIEQVTKMLEMGLGTFHLRKPKSSTAEMRQYIERIPARFHDRIVIHSHHNLAVRFNIAGIHITRQHRKRWFRLWWNEQCFRLKNKKIIRTASLRKLGSLYDGEGFYDYVFLSPIFDSLSGKLQGGFNEFSLIAALKKTSYRVIARGGIDLSRLEKVQELGFAGLAFYTAIWRKKDPVKAFETILKRAAELKLIIT